MAEKVAVIQFFGFQVKPRPVVSYPGDIKREI